MGANLCSLRPANNGANGNHQFDTKTPFIELLKPDCLKAKKMKQLHQEEDKVTEVAKVTRRVKRLNLEEWILASPAPVRRSSSSGGSGGGGIGSRIHASETLQVPKQSNYRVCPVMSSSTSTPSPYVELEISGGDHLSVERNSLSMEKRKKVEETAGQVQGMERSSSQDRKVRKRVSFRLPQEADIIIFYSPHEDEVGD